MTLIVDKWDARIDLYAFRWDKDPAEWTRLLL